MENRIEGDGDEEMLLFNLVYCSRAASGFELDEIRAMVSRAQEKNARLSITGWLVFSHGIFFQWLEGSRTEVSKLMTCIKDDRRHSSVVVLSEAEEVRGRVFAAWDMELVSADEIRGVLLDAVDACQDPRSAGVLRQTLKELEARSPTA